MKTKLSYMFAEWLIEAYYLRILRLSHTYSTLYYTLQKFAAKINGKLLLWKIISSFILLLNINKLFIGIDSAIEQISIQSSELSAICSHASWILRSPHFLYRYHIGRFADFVYRLT
jgi:hypothetical protein